MKEGWVELLTIEKTFWLEKLRWLIIHPSLLTPNFWSQRGWNARTEKVLVVKPDGREMDATAQINMTHLNYSDPKVPIEERWRITMWLTDRTEDEVPIGSKVLVSNEVRGAILPDTAG